MHNSTPSTGQVPTARRWLVPLLLMVAAVLVNEFTFHLLFAERGAAHSGRYVYLSYYAPWFLRSLDALLLLSAWRLARSSRTPVFLLKCDTNLNLLILIFSFFLFCFSNPVFAGKFMWLRLSGTLFLLFQTLRVIHLAWVKDGSRAWMGPRLGLPLAGVLMAVLLAESAFFFVARSHHTVQSYAGRNWYHRYWETNALGYRDGPVAAADLKGKKVILCLGDSFTAGAGINDPQDRYSGRLQAALGPDFRVLNLGVNGLGPEGELEQLEQFPFSGDVLVLQWFVNDIHQAAGDAGMSLRAAMPSNSGLQLSLHPRHLLYSVNYLWWSQQRPEHHVKYFEFLHRAYREPGAISLHLERLETLVRRGEAKGMRVVVMMFPRLMDVAGSRFAIGPVQERLRSGGIPVLDLSPVYLREEPGSLIVNANDHHPNERAHALAADTLLIFLKNQRILP